MPSKRRSTASRKNRIAIPVVSAAIVVVPSLLVAWALNFGNPRAGTESPAASGTPRASVATSVSPDSVSDSVGPDGFVLSLDGVEVIGQPGVAPVGTTATAQLIDAPDLGEFDAFATPVGRAVDITLGDGLQPLNEISIVFDVDPTDWAQTLFAMGESHREAHDADFVETIRDASSYTITAKTAHLSWYAVTNVDEDNLAEKFGDWMNVAAGVQTTKPDCVDQPSSFSGSYTLARPWPTLAWVCASDSATGVEVYLQSNSGLVFDVFVQPDAQMGTPTTLNAEGIATAAAARQLGGMGLSDGDGVLVAGGSISATLPKPFDVANVRIAANAGLTQIGTIVWGTQMLLPDELSGALDWSSCALGAVDSTVSGGTAETAGAIVDCVATGIGDTAGDLLGMLMSAPGKLKTQIEGAVREISGTASEEFAVYLVSPDAVRDIPVSATWLYELPNRGGNTSGEPDTATVQVGTELVSFPLSTNQWIGCDGETNTVTYDLNSQWGSISFAFALQSHTPANLTADWEVSADGVQIYSSVSRLGDPLERLTLDVRGVRQLAFKASTADACTAAEKGYGALVQAYVDAEGATAENRVGTGSRIGGDDRYQIFRGVDSSWEAAAQHCVAEGGHLAVIKDADEDAHVYALLKAHGESSAYFGLHRTDNDQWQWVTGEPLTYANWAPGEPNTEGGTEEFGMYYWKFEDGTWNDGNFGNGTSADPVVYVCELP